MTAEKGSRKMGRKWQKTRFKGVRFYEHDSRKHGVKKDRYLAIRYQKDGKRVEEGIGWTSERDPEDGQYWTEEKAALVLERLKGAARHGKKGAPTRLSEKREIESRRRAAELEEKERQEREAKTFSDFFVNNYLPETKPLKTWGAVQAEQSLFKTWLSPIIGNIPLVNLSQIDLERLKKTMINAGKSHRTVRYAFSVVSQTWTRAVQEKFVLTPCPAKEVNLPRVQNERIRFLTRDEAALLLQKLKEKSLQLYRISFLSLSTGGRFSEIAGLIWRDMNMEAETITFRNTKSGKDRTIFMTQGVRDMLAEMPRGPEDGLVFKDKKGGRIKSVSASFERVVNEIGLNAGVEDPRYRFTFHGLRHSAASFLVAAGVDLFRIREILGHASFRMTQRYSHVSRENLKEAMKGLEDQLNRPLSGAGRKVIRLKK